MDNNFIFREMTIDDYDEIIDLWKKTPGIVITNADSKENFDFFLKKNYGLNFVCLYENKIIGTILTGCDGRRGYLYHVMVSENFRRKGIGEKLVEKSLNSLKKLNIEKCHLFVLCDNELGISFWNKTGWKKRNDIFIFSKDV